MADAATRARELIEARLAELRDEARKLERALEVLRGDRRRRAPRRTPRRAVTRPPQTQQRSGGRTRRKATAKRGPDRTRSATRKK